MATMIYDPVAIARQFLFVREAQDIGQNRGARVEAIQHWALGTFGDSWCDEFSVGMVLDICFQGNSPFPRKTETNASVQQTLDFARAQEWITTTPVPGDLVVSVDPTTGHGHHIAIVTVVTPLTSIAGNTSEDGSSSNGDRVAEHKISSANKVFIHYPRT
jgi:hypothetical protein